LRKENSRTPFYFSLVPGGSPSFPSVTSVTSPDVGFSFVPSLVPSGFPPLNHQVPGVVGHGEELLFKARLSGALNSFLLLTLDGSPSFIDPRNIVPGVISAKDTAPSPQIPLFFPPLLPPLDHRRALPVWCSMRLVIMSAACRPVVRRRVLPGLCSLPLSDFFRTFLKTGQGNPSLFLASHVGERKQVRRPLPLVFLFLQRPSCQP